MKTEPKPGETRPLKWFPEHERTDWFWKHYDEAARQVVNFFRGNNISLTGKAVADIGCGDGITDLGVMHKADPRSLTGFDLVPTDTDLLRTLGLEHGVLKELPLGLEFVQSQPSKLAADDRSFDFAYSWSAFEHVDEPGPLLAEIRRILSPDGVLMLQLYPFYHSQHGSHLWRWFPGGFAQFLHSPDELVRRARADPGPDPEWAEALLWDFQHLNRITLDGLQQAISSNGFRIAKLELITESVQIPLELSEKLPLSLTGIAGAKLLATKA